MSAAQVVIGLIALLHLWIAVLEMFLWNRAVHVFEVPEAERDNVLLRTMLQNQGIYNAFLSAGLFWGLFHPDSAFGLQLQVFFLGCVGVAGVVGAVTANGRILLVQSVPALFALGLLANG